MVKMINYNIMNKINQEIKNIKFKEELQKYHHLFRGKQDEDINEYMEEFKDRLKRIRERKIIGSRSIKNFNKISSNRIEIRIPLSGYSVCNFRTTCEKFSRIRIVIGGLEMYNIDKIIFPYLRKFYRLEENIIPFYFSKIGIKSLKYNQIIFIMMKN